MPVSVRMRGVFVALLAAQMVIGCGAPDLRALPWQTAEVTADPQVLSVGYAADRCEVLHHAEVSYESTYVILSLFARRNELPCSGLRFPQRVSVPLREPLAGRPVEAGPGR